MNATNPSANQDDGRPAALHHHGIQAHLNHSRPQRGGHTPLRRTRSPQAERCGPRTCRAPTPARRSHQTPMSKKRTHPPWIHRPPRQQNPHATAATHQNKSARRPIAPHTIQNHNPSPDGRPKTKAIMVLISCMSFDEDGCFFFGNGVKRPISQTQLRPSHFFKEPIYLIGDEDLHSQTPTTKQRSCCVKPIWPRRQK